MGEAERQREECHLKTETDWSGAGASQEHRRLPAITRNQRGKEDSPLLLSQPARSYQTSIPDFQPPEP